MKVVLVDSGGANIGSVRYALERLGVAAEMTAVMGQDPGQLYQALEAEFEHAHILCWLPQSPEDELQPAVRVAAAIESLISACNTASAKRQRIL